MSTQSSKKIPSNENFFVRVNNEVKEIDNIDSTVVFENVDKECDVYIEQHVSKDNMSVLNIVLFIFTMAIQGVFNILLMNTDSDWYNNIRAYCVKAKVQVDLSKSSRISFSYVNAKYDKKNEKWLPPVFDIEQCAVSEIEFIVNEKDFRNQYVNYVKRIVSILSVLIIVMLVLLYASIVNTNYIAIVFISVLIVAFSVLIIAVSIKEKSRLSRIYRLFNEQRLMK